jgi:hypothetical protein
LKEIYSEFGIVMEEEKPQKQYTISSLVDLINAQSEVLDPTFIEKIYHTIAAKGKKFIENMSDSNMAKIPGSTKHNGKKFHENPKNANMAKMPGMNGKTKGGSLKMLNGKVKKSK